MTRPLALALALAAAGCGSPAIPVGDGSVGYEVAEFKDDAPANATVAEFPRTFVDAAGAVVDLAALRGRKVVLVVLRGVPQTTSGAFCPSCLAQAGGLMASRSEFEKRRAEVLVLFPGPAERVGEFVETARRQTTGEPPAAFRLLLDRDLAACDRLGIRSDLAKPSTYVLDTEGRVTYAYVGVTSTDRPSVKAVLAQLDRAK
jgi:peroxiredoxin Q/BCP